MARDKITEYSSTASENTVVGDVNIAENSALPSDMNNAVREVLSHQKEAFGSGTPLYVDQTNNRVGVNKTPTVALDVSGALSVSGAFTSQGIDDNADATAITITSAEKVGIGISNPASYDDGGDRLVVGDTSGRSGITIVTGTSNDGSINFADGTSGSASYMGFINYHHNTNEMKLATNGSVKLTIDANGHVTMSSQPAFHAQPTGDNNNVTGDATTFSAVNIAFTEIFDQNGDFNHDDGTNRGKFTAPVTGKYLLNLSLFLSGLTSASTSGVASIATSNRTYNFNYNPYNVANVGVNSNYNVSVLVDMDTNDTANFGLYVNGNGSKVVDLAGSQCRFSGHLVC